MLERVLTEDLRFIITLMSDRARRFARLALLFTLLGSALMIAVPYGISRFIDGLTSELVAGLITGGLLFLGFELQIILVGWLRQQVRERFFQEEFWFLPQEVIRRYFARPLQMLTVRNSEIDGGGVESLREKVWGVIHSYIFSIVPGYGLIVFGLTACLFAYPPLGVAAVLYAAADLYVGRRMNESIQRRMRPVIDAFKRWDRRMVEWTHSVDHVKSQGVETRILQQIHDEVQPALKEDDRVWRVDFARWVAYRRSASLVCAAGLYTMVGYLVLTEMITIAAGVMIFFSFERVRSELGVIVDQQREVQFNLAGIAKYRRVLEQPVPFHYAEGRPFAARAISVAFDQVSLTVPEEDGNRLILKDVSFSVQPGERVGIVGPSGAGKSQLMKLLVRSTDPDQGRVLVSNHDLRELRTETFLRYVGVIMQKSEPFEDTILGNLMFGVSHLDSPTHVNRDELEARAWAALRKAGLDLGRELTNGLYTNIGYKGLRLSGGQQQRLQIAATHFKLMSPDVDRPRLIIADEPTASLDSMSELTVMEHLSEALPVGTTLLMVAHRLSTVAHLDRIVFVRPLDQCLTGTTQVTVHDSLAELYRAEPLFREMADAQGFVPHTPRQVSA